MKHQPTWRGHRAPVEGAEATGPARPRRWPVVVLAVLSLGAIGAAIVAAVQIATPDGPGALPDITAGTCLSSPQLASGAAGVSQLVDVPCAEEHDAEVFALLRLRTGEVLDDVGERCMSLATDLGHTDLADRGLEVRPLALDGTPAPGDTVACFVRRKDGEPRRGAAFTTAEENDR